MRDLQIPYSVEHVTSQWLTDTLASAGAIKSSTVTSFDAERLAVGQGFSGQISRLKLAYDSQEDGAPQSLIAKFPATDSTVRAVLNRLRLYEREVRFYEEVAPQVGLSTPRRYYSATDRETGHHVLLLEDLAPARVGDNVAGCSDKDAELVVSEIAQFHAAFWESPRLADLEWMFSYQRDADRKQERYGQLWHPFLEKVGDLLPPALLEVGQRLGDNLASISRQLGEPPRTVLHGDYRLDNIVFGAPGAGSSLTVIDWQVSEIGRGVADVAYFVAHSIDPEQRRATELELLRNYHSVLLAWGVRDYDFEACLHDYRLSLLHHLSRVVGGTALFDISSHRGQQFVRVILERFDSALTDHKVMELMPE